MKAMLYAADLLPRLQELFSFVCFATIVVILVGFAFCSDFFTDEKTIERRDEAQQEKARAVYDAYRKVRTIAIVVGSVAFLVAFFMPSRTTIYLITGITLAETVANSAGDSELVDLTKQLLIKTIAEEQPDQVTDTP